jgi:hypothetical protein
MNPALGAKEKKDTHHPQPLLLPHQTENNNNNNKTTKQTRGKICNHNCRPKITTQLHKLLKQFIHKTKKIHPQFTNKVTNFSPNLLASLKFFAGQNLEDNFC